MTEIMLFKTKKLKENYVKRAKEFASEIKNGIPTKYEQETRRAQGLMKTLFG